MQGVAELVKQRAVAGVPVTRVEQDAHVVGRANGIAQTGVGNVGRVYPHARGLFTQTQAIGHRLHSLEQAVTGKGRVGQGWGPFSGKG